MYSIIDIICSYFVDLQDSNYCAVEALFNRHGDTVLPHRYT